MGDISLTSDNEYLVNAINPDLPIITYEKQKIKSQKINFDNLGAFDVKSFDSPIGGITNLASNLYAMKGLFPEGSKERVEIEKRIRLLRRAQGDSIDAAKGAVFVPPNPIWSHRQKYIPITDNMTDEQKQEAQKKNEEIKFNNSICCDKKTYFFGYVYPKEMERLKSHKSQYKLLCKAKFGCELKQLQQKQDKTAEEKKFIREYYKYMPLFNSDCTMNVLARYIEDYEFARNRNNKYFDYSCLMSDKNREFKRSTCEKIKKAIHEMRTDFIIIGNKTATDTVYNIEGDVNMDEKVAYYDILLEDYRAIFRDIISNEEELVDYIVYVYYNQCKSDSKELMWQLYSEILVNNIKKNSNCHYEVIKSDSGQEFFGEKFVLQEVPNGV